MSFNSVYTQIWRVLLHLAADPFPEVSDLAMKVLNSIAYKVGSVWGVCALLAQRCFGCRLLSGEPWEPDQNWAFWPLLWLRGRDGWYFPEHTLHR